LEKLLGPLVSKCANNSTTKPGTRHLAQRLLFHILRNQHADILLPLLFKLLDGPSSATVSSTSRPTAVAATGASTSHVNNNSNSNNYRMKIAVLHYIADFINLPSSIPEGLPATTEIKYWRNPYRILHLCETTRAVRVLVFHLSSGVFSHI
jgi:hypothetical protein